MSAGQRRGAFACPRTPHVDAGEQEQPDDVDEVPVPGGKLVISAQGVEDYSRTRMVLRIKLKTSLGDRQYTHDVNISLFP